MAQRAHRQAGLCVRVSLGFVHSHAGVCAAAVQRYDAETYHQAAGRGAGPVLAERVQAARHIPGAVCRRRVRLIRVARERTGRLGCCRVWHNGVALVGQGRCSDLCCLPASTVL